MWCWRYYYSYLPLTLFSNNYISYIFIRIHTSPIRIMLERRVRYRMIPYESFIAAYYLRKWRMVLKWILLSSVYLLQGLSDPWFNLLLLLLLLLLLDRYQSLHWPVLCYTRDLITTGQKTFAWPFTRRGLVVRHHRIKRIPKERYYKNPLTVKEWIDGATVL